MLGKIATWHGIMHPFNTHSLTFPCSHVIVLRQWLLCLGTRFPWCVQMLTSQHSCLQPIYCDICLYYAIFLVCFYIPHVCMSLSCKENCLHKLFDIFNRGFIVDDLAYLNIIIYTFPWSTFYIYTKSVQSCLCGFVSHMVPQSCWLLLWYWLH